MRVDPVVVGACGASAEGLLFYVSDSYHWPDPEVEFTLGADLRGSAEVAFSGAQHTRTVCQVCPPGTGTASLVDRSNGLDPPLRVSLETAWNKDDDRMEVQLQTFYDGTDNLFHRCTLADGKWSEVRIFPYELGFVILEHWFAEPDETRSVLENLILGDPRTIFLNTSLKGVCP
jgi:hypothetical protein